MWIKLLSLGASSLVGLSLLSYFPPPDPPDGPPPPPKEKGKEKPKGKREPGPGGDLRKAYDLLRRLRADDSRTEERLRDWTDRAVRLYRRGVKAQEDGDHRLAHEYGASAHDLARAVDHARNASRFERPDPELPPPPEGPGPEDTGERARHDLFRAYDRIREIRERVEGKHVRDARFYLDAARDLYNAARRDLEDGREDRAGELARAAEAMTHVPEHLAHAQGVGEGADREGPPPPEAKKKGFSPGEFIKPDFKKKEGPPPPPKEKEEPKEKREHRRGLPPPLPD